MCKVGDFIKRQYITAKAVMFLYAVVDYEVYAIVVDECESDNACLVGVGGCLTDSRRLRICSSCSARLMVLSVVVTETTSVYP